MENNIEELRKTVTELAENIIARAHQLYNGYTTGEMKGFDERIVFIIEDIESLVDGVKIAKGDGWFPEDINELNRKLGMLVEAMEGQDELLFADILMYELVPLIENLKENL